MSEYKEIYDDGSVDIISLARKARERGAKVIFTGNNALGNSLRIETKEMLRIDIDTLIRDELKVKDNLKDNRIEK